MTAIDKEGETVLQKAVGSGSEEVVRLLIEKGAHVTATDRNGETALHKAAGGGSGEMVRLLIEKGADAFPPDDKQLVVSRASVGGGFARSLGAGVVVSTPTNQLAHLALDFQPLEDTVASPEEVRARAIVLQDIFSSFYEMYPPSEFQAPVFSLKKDVLNTY